MVAKFTEPEDYQYLCMLARKSQGEEKQRRKEIVEFCDSPSKKKQPRSRNTTRLQEIKQSGWQVWHFSLTMKRS